jgi:Pentapeptide repeats (8 copies)
MWVGLIEVLIIVGEFGVDRTVGCGAMQNPLVVVTRQAPKPPMLGALIPSNALSIGEIIGRDRDVEVKWGCPGEAFWPGGDGYVLERGVMTREELLERYAAGERLFIDIDLSGVNLGAVNIQGIRLRRCNLENSNLSGINLLGGDLLGSNLRGANLSDANLEGVGMQGTNLENATLLGAETVEAEFAGAFFHNTVAEEGHTIEGPEYFD